MTIVGNHVCFGIFDQICSAFAFFRLIPKKFIVVGLGNLRCQYQEVSIVALIVGINRFSAIKLKRILWMDRQTDELIWGGLGNLQFLKVTLAARGLEEPRNSQELLTESVDLTKFVSPLPFSAKYLKKLRLGNLFGVNTKRPRL